MTPNLVAGSDDSDDSAVRPVHPAYRCHVPFPLLSRHVRTSGLGLVHPTKVPRDGPGSYSMTPIVCSHVSTNFGQCVIGSCVGLNPKACPPSA